MPPQRRAGNTEIMMSRIGALIRYPSQAKVWAISAIGRSAGKQGWGFAEGQVYVTTIVVRTDVFKANPEWKLS
jgi:hypothetical protein